MPRKTIQREAIRQVLEEAGRPLSPEEILAEAREHVPKLGIATVYRALKSLREENFLVPVELPGEAPRYEIHQEHHHHFHCRQCGKVFDVEGCPSGLKAISPPGFVLEDHELILYGRCDQC